MTKRVALITNETSLVGGLPTLVLFLHRILSSSGRYSPALISLATSASDSQSVRLRAPETWLRQPLVASSTWNGLPVEHVGVWGSELEFQRYRPRRKLTEMLRSYDLLQFIVGSPPWACVAEHVNRPLMIWTATTTRRDRESQMREGSAARRVWSSVMVPITEVFERRALQAADAVFALSDYTRELVTPISGPEKVFVAPCGVDTDTFYPALQPRGNYILCVGRLSDPRKNVGLLLNAYAALHKSLKSIPHLYLVGDPPSAEWVTRIERLGLRDKVHLLGPQAESDLAQLYRDALFFVLSSNEEGLGIVILEAMASGLPVVATACGGPATMVKEGETGFLTPTGDVAALAGAMQKLLTQPELRARMGRAGRKRVEERFSFAAAGKVFLDKYDELAEAIPKSSVQSPMSEASPKSKIQSFSEPERSESRTVKVKLKPSMPDS